MLPPLAIIFHYLLLYENVRFYQVEKIPQLYNKLDVVLALSTQQAYRDSYKKSKPRTEMWYKPTPKPGHLAVIRV